MRRLLAWLRWEIRLLIAERGDHVSAAWRLEHKRSQQSAGIDGVAWRWPVRKLFDESAQMNSKRLRKRA